MAELVEAVVIAVGVVVVSGVVGALTALLVVMEYMNE